MDILISGGSGLIGRPLTDALLAQGHRVTVLSRSPEKHRAALPGAAWAKWNGRTADGWAHIMETTDAVVNLAGASIAGENLAAIFTQRWSDENKRRIRQSRNDAGQAITQAIRAAKNKPHLLIQASAVGYYGPRGVEEIDETAVSGDDFLSQVCAEWEASTADVEGMGVRRVMLRTGLVLTAEGGVLPTMLLPFRLFVGGAIGSGKQAVPWIHIEDEIGAILHLIADETAQGAYNLSAPNPVTNAEFGKTAARVLKRPYYFPTPAFALKLALGEKATIVLDGQRAVPARLLESGYRFAFPYLEPALRDLQQK